MGKVNFDKFAADYDELLQKQLFFFESDTDYFAQYKVSLVKNLLTRNPARMLDFGCGVGNNIRHLITVFPDATITGCDVSTKCLDVAKTKNPSAEFFNIADNTDSFVGRFDLVFIANVFHHIPPEQRLEILHLVRQFMSENGELFIFEHNPYNPVTRHVVQTCPLDADAELIKPKHLIALLTKAGFSAVNRQYLLFFPSFLSKLRPLEKYLTSIPLGGQYVIQASV
jgi:SAM-dependent methyltransferase